jgi:hypothetical protein
MREIVEVVVVIEKKHRFTFGSNIQEGRGIDGGLI